MPDDPNPASRRGSIAAVSDLTAPCPSCGFHRDTPNHVYGCRSQTLTEAVEEAERTDPAVAAAARGLDEAVDRIVYESDLHRFRPLPWDRAGDANDTDSTAVNHD